jgi:hypothetical protein
VSITVTSTISETPNDLFLVKYRGVTCAEGSDGEISVEFNYESNYVYQVFLNNTEFGEVDKQNKLLINQLSAGEYELCLKLNGIGVRCYIIKIDEPEKIFVTTELDKKSRKVELNITGGYDSNFHIELNGRTFDVNERKIRLDLSEGLNYLVVRSDQECLGEFREIILIENDIEIFPNPFSDLLRIWFSENTNIKNIRVYNLEGQLIINRNVNDSETGLIEIETDYFSSGLYLLEITTDEFVIHKKILKK